MAAIAVPTSGLLHSYERAMQRRPLATKMATCAVGFGTGDLVAQALRFAKAPQLPDMPRRNLARELDVARVARMACFGALIAAPQMHVFFQWLDKVRLAASSDTTFLVLSVIRSAMAFFGLFGCALHGVRAACNADDISCICHQDASANS